MDSNLSDTHKKTKVSGPRDEDLHLNLLTIHDMFQIFSSHDIYCEVRFYLQFLFLNLLSFFPVKNKMNYIYMFSVEADCFFFVVCLCVCVCALFLKANPHHSTISFLHLKCHHKERNQIL